MLLSTDSLNFVLDSEGKFAVTIWFKTNVSSKKQILINHHDTNILYINADNNITSDIASGSGCGFVDGDGLNFTSDEWHFAAISGDADSLSATIFLDNRSFNCDGSLSVGSESTLWIGTNHTFGDYFNGSIDNSSASFASYINDG